MIIPACDQYANSPKNDDSPEPSIASDASFHRRSHNASVEITTPNTRARTAKIRSGTATGAVSPNQLPKTVHDHVDDVCGSTMHTVRTTTQIARTRPRRPASNSPATFFSIRAKSFR